MNEGVAHNNPPINLVRKPPGKGTGKVGRPRKYPLNPVVNN